MNRKIESSYNESMQTISEIICYPQPASGAHPLSPVRGKNWYLPGTRIVFIKAV